jgi:hypothetical protein
MSGTCNCFCCQGRGCSTSYAGERSLSSISQCTQSFCVNSFPVACKKDISIGGHITSTFTANSLPDGSDANTLFTPLFWLVTLIVLVMVILLEKRRLHCENCGLNWFLIDVQSISTNPSCPRCRRALHLASIRIDSNDYCDYGSTSHSYSTTDHSSSSHDVTTSDEAY